MLNAFRHQRVHRRETCGFTRPGCCAQRLSASEGSSRGFVVLYLGRRCVLNAFRHQRVHRFGAEPITPEEHLIVNEIEANALATAIATSPQPFAEIIAPIDARKVLSVQNQTRVSPVIPQNREVAAVQAGPQPQPPIRRFSARRR